VFLLVRRGEPGFVITWLWKNHNGYLFLENELPNRGFKIETLDGDAVRRNLSPDLGHKLVNTIHRAIGFFPKSAIAC
jgi:Adenylylsulphate kinase